MKLIEENYITPVGYRDFPFAYVFNPSVQNVNQLTNGNTYYDIQIQTQGDSDFILRRICGVPTVVDTFANGGRWNYKGPNRQYANGNQSTGIAANNTWVVVPEKWFKYNEALWIDLYDVKIATNACGGTPIPYGSIAFMGLKRFKDTSGYRSQASPYRYKEMPQRYEFSLTIDWAAFSTGTVFAAPHRFIQQMDNYDFELLRITIGQQGVAGTLQTQDFAITLFDPNMHQTSNLPLLQGFLNAGKPTPATQPPYQAVWPVPSIVYPAGSAITFDVSSLLCSTQLPQTYDISFEGVWRLPCL